MAAKIRVTVYATPGGIVVGAPSEQVSRDDLRAGQQVVLYSVDAHSTYDWTIAYAPKSTGGASLGGTASAAAMLAPENGNSRTAKFNVDLDGPYLVRLVVDAGLPGESTQFLRLRQLTRFGDLKIPSAGERNDQNGKIPADVPAGGWADDDNQNIQKLLLLVRRQATTGRVLWVDANRGRETTNNQEDQAVLVDLPGTLATAKITTGMKVKAEGHGDFATITSALAYAMDYAARGESAPSAAEPWTIFIQPGLYVEDLVLQAHVHLVGLGAQPRLDRETGTGYVHPVTVRTANSGGATHAFAPASATAEVVLSNLAFENTGVTTKAVIEHTAGVLVLDRCVVFQRGNDANQGPALSAITASATAAPRTVLVETIVASLANGASRWAVVHDAPLGQLVAERSVFLGARACIKFNPTLYGGAPTGTNQDGVLRLTLCEVRGRLDYSLRAYGSTNVVDRTIVGGEGGITKAALFDAFGAAPATKVGSTLVQVVDSQIDGDLVFDVSGTSAVGTRTLKFQGTMLGGELDLAGGAPDVLEAGDKAQSIEYEPAHANPVTGAVVLAAGQQLGVGNVQDALDVLVQALLPNGVPPGFVLDDAYDGIAAMDSPPTRGAGLGRTIVADQGAVRITGATPPFTPTDGTLKGGLQIEGVIDVGPLQSDGLGSDIQVNPNPFGAGPRINLGRTIWPNDVGDVNRGITSATVQARATSTPRAYHLRLRTQDSSASGTGALGRLILEAGSSVTPAAPAAGPNAGSVHVLAGSYTNATAGGAPGEVYLVPGAGTAPAAGKVLLARRASATASSLTANAAGAGGVAGTVTFATPNGEVSVAVLVGDSMAQVAAKATLTGVLVGSSPGGKLKVTTADLGPNADVLYVRDSTSGTLNAALGDLRVSAGAIYAAGAYGDLVGLACTANGVLTVYGDVIVASPSKATATGTVDTTVALANANVATAVPGVTFATAASTAYLLTADVVMNDKTDGQVRVMRISQAAYRAAAGAPVLDGIVNVIFASGGAALALASVEFVASGNDIGIEVTGVAAKDVKWRVVCEATSVGEPA